SGLLRARAAGEAAGPERLQRAHLSQVRVQRVVIGEGRERVEAGGVELLPRRVAGGATEGERDEEDGRGQAPGARGTSRHGRLLRGHAGAHNSTRVPAARAPARSGALAREGLPGVTRASGLRPSGCGLEVAA